MRRAWANAWTRDAAALARRLHGAAQSLVLALLLAGCFAPDAPPATPVERGRAIYTASICFQCHGMDLAGTLQGPPLHHMAAHWTREELVRFLKDPAEYTRRSDRLQQIRRQFPAEMPKFEMDPGAREDLAEFLLTQPPAPAP